MPGANVETAATELLFRNDIPVLRTSLARHGLLDLSVPPTPRRLPVEPRSSEDLTAADEEEDGWVRASDPEGRESSRSEETVEGQDTHWHAMLEVNSVMVGHVRAAQEIRQALLSSPAYQRCPLNVRKANSMGVGGGGRQMRSVPLKVSSPTGAGAGAGGAAAAPPAARRSGGGNMAHAAATAALKAARMGRAGGAARKTGGGPSPGPEESQAASAWPKVSMSAVLDIAVNLFGPGGDGGSGVDDNRRSSAGNGAKRGETWFSAGRGGLEGHDEGLMTFSIDVPTGGSMSLGITVKELGGGAVFVEDLRRPPGQPPGAAERAGVAIGDVIHGINYEPLEKGLRHTSALLAKAITLAGFVKLQISRVISPGDRRRLIPGRDCPIVTELMWRTAQLRKVGVLTSGERYTIAGLILRRMAWEEGTTIGPPEPPRTPVHLAVLTTAPFPSLLKSAATAQLNSLVLRVKGLREAIYVRCLHAKFTVEPVKVSSVWGPPATGEAADSAAAADTPTPVRRVTVLYVLRAEDVATGREWLVFPRYSDFSELHQELLIMWPPIADLPFPPRRPVSTLLQGEPGIGAGVIEERVVGLEAFLHGALALLGTYASLDPRCAGGLRLVQDFLGMPKGLVSAEAALSPTLCDQKRLELLLYKLLNQADSPAARMKHFLMRDFGNELLMAPDVESLMRATSSRLGSLQEFLLEQHGEKLSSFMETSHANGSSDAREATTRKAVRRQVELSLYLPLRRCLWKELMLRLKGDLGKLKRAIKALRRSPPSAFGLESTDILSKDEWGAAKEAMGQAIRTALPTDQIDCLRRAAKHIITLHASLHQSIPSVDTPSVYAGGDDDDGELGCANKNPDREAAGVAAGHDETVGWRRGEECEEGRGETENMPVVKDAVAAKDEFPFRQNSDAGSSGSRERYGGSGLTAAVFSSMHRGQDAAQGAGDDSNDDDGRPLGLARATASSSDKRRHALPLLPRQEQVGGENEEPIATTAAAIGATRAANGSSDSKFCEQPPGEGRGASGEDELFARASLSGSRSWRASSRVMNISPLPGASRASSWDSIESELSTGSCGGRVAGIGFGSDQRAGTEAREDCNLVANGGARTGGVEADLGEIGEISATTQPEEIMSADDFLPLFSLVLVHSAPLDLLLPQTSLTHLMDAAELLSEAGYLVATLEASVSYITQVYSSSCANERQDCP